MKYHEGEDTVFAQRLMFEGSTAYHQNNDAKVTENPYAEDTPEFKWWRTGFTRAWMDGWVEKNIAKKEAARAIQ